MNYITIVNPLHQMCKCVTIVLTINLRKYLNREFISHSRNEYLGFTLSSFKWTNCLDIMVYDKVIQSTVPFQQMFKVLCVDRSRYRFVVMNISVLSMYNNTISKIHSIPPTPLFPLNSIEICHKFSSFRKYILLSIKFKADIPIEFTLVTSIINSTK